MTPSLRRKLEALAERREELEHLLADPGVLADNARFRDLSREFAQLEPVATALAAEARAKADLAAAEAMRDDPELAELAGEEITAALREASLSGDTELVRAAERLFPSRATDPTDATDSIPAPTPKPDDPEPAPQA